MRVHTEPALEFLDNAYEKGFRDYRLLQLDPVLDALRAEPGFIALARSINRDCANLGAGSS